MSNASDHGDERTRQADLSQTDSTRDSWHSLAALTPARIALGHVGAALPTARHLDLQLAHARARDAVWRPFDAATLAAAFREGGHDVIRVHSAAGDRREYLERPDLGRRLSSGDTTALARDAGEFDVGFVVGDGLAPLAAERHAVALVRAVTAQLDSSWRVAPIVVAEQMRVALGDEVGAALRMRMVVVLLGERPGMSAQDSLGAYVTWAPRPGRSDAERNCVSNVRPEGLAYDAAANTLAWLLEEARRRAMTGVALRVEQGDGRTIADHSG